ncbi:MAG: ComF family protein [Patescibacteria group bacterium]|jgi:ComF family protein
MVTGEVKEKIKDFLFPYFCAGCNKEGEWWCKNCRKTEVAPSIIKAEAGLEAVSVLFNYDEHSAIGYLIKQFKYNYVKDISELWRAVIVEANLYFENNTMLIPVPLFWRRERERGYNQANILAQILAEVSKKEPVLHALTRVRPTLQQAKLNRAERQINVLNAFEWRASYVPERVVLVDDVYTTGATMKECASVLKQAGVKKVSGFVLAHG